jgi:serine/threonine protein kinase
VTTTIKDHTRVEVSAELVGKRIGKYKVVEVVGKGGMGCVYGALNTTINKRVAIKVIDPVLARNAEANARFQREALAASAIESPHIVQIFDAGETDDGTPFIVMELMRGQDLGGYISENGRLDLGDALNVFAQILKGLAHAHEAGIIHRDLKPDNVFLVQRDDDPVLVKLLDFGVSKISRPSADVPLQTLTRQGTVVGTPFYMSPEQAQAFPDVDGRTDIYSAGAILFECLTGRPPHVGRAYEQVIVNICMKDAEDVRAHNADVPDGIAELIAKALSRERDDRYPDARTMLAALKDKAPQSLDIATSSPRLAAISMGGNTPMHKLAATPLTSTPHVVPTPHVVRTPTTSPANELADTVGVSEAPPELTESGINTKSVTAETVRSQPRSRTRRKWPVYLAPGVAVMIALMLWFRAGGDVAPVAEADSVDEGSESEQASASATIETDVAAATPDEKVAANDPATKPAASASAVAAAHAQKPPTAKPPQAKPTVPQLAMKPPVDKAKDVKIPESPAKKTKPTPKPLQLVEEY